MVQYINESGAQVVSIDMPSGLFGEDNRDNNHRYIVRADLTLSFQFPKLAFVLPENERFTGEWKILDIALHPDGITNAPTNLYYTETADAAALLRPRNRFSDKRDMGHALLAAGSYGMMGAAVLAARACMHAGCGLLTLHAPSCGYQIIQQSVPEALFSADINETRLSGIRLQKPYTAIGIGPGIGHAAPADTALDQLISQLRRPAVLDADALNILSEHTDWLSRLPANTVLTPHIREFDRLFGKCDTGYERLLKALEISKRYHLLLVLKGANTAVVLPRGEVHFNSTGNPGMSTAGSGDVLTGIILGLLAQGYTPPDAAVLGVFIHGLAGDLAAEADSQESLTASGIIAFIGKAFHRLHTCGK